MTDNVHYLGDASISQHNGRVEWRFDYMDPESRNLIQPVLDAMDTFTDTYSGFRLTLRVEEFE